MKLEEISEAEEGIGEDVGNKDQINHRFDRGYDP